jgi:hypothetical protein
MPEDTQLMERLVTAYEALVSKEMHTKTPAQFSTYTPLHGSGGIFAVNGLEREIITAHMRPFGITSVLPRIPSVFVDPRFGSITGFTAVNGSQPDHACDDAPTGYMKGCDLTARFGRIRFDTQTIDIDDVMLRLHRGDFTDLMLKGRLLGMTGLTPSGLDEQAVLDLVTMSEMVIVGVNFERELNHQTWQGVATVANEFPGLDVQIATGQKDADTGTLCPALDSDVKSFAYDLVDGSGRDIVEYLSMLMRYLNSNAQGMGLEPVEWVVVMRPDLWFELSAVWPCRYNTTKCSVIDHNGIIDAEPSVDAAVMTQQRDAMRQGLYIDIEGRRYPVILDTGIFEHNNINNANCAAGQYASSIYVVPMSITGGFPVTYMEYVDFTKAQSDVNMLRGMQTFFWTDGGFYSWAYEAVKWCYKIAGKVEARVVLRTPQLAGRIDAVKYSPLQHLRDTDPAGAYFKDGGVSLRGGLSTPFAVWTSRS